MTFDEPCRRAQLKRSARLPPSQCERQGDAGRCCQRRQLAISSGEQPQLRRDRSSARSCRAGIPRSPPIASTSRNGAAEPSSRRCRARISRAVDRPSRRARPRPRTPRPDGSSARSRPPAQVAEPSSSAPRSGVSCTPSRMTGARILAGPGTSPCAPRAARPRQRERRCPRPRPAGPASSQLLGVRPGRAMHRALLPPRPHLLADERQKRGEQALEGRQRQAQRAAHRAPLDLPGRRRSGGP